MTLEGELTRQHGGRWTCTDLSPSPVYIRIGMTHERGGVIVSREIDIPMYVIVDTQRPGGIRAQVVTRTLNVCHTYGLAIATLVARLLGENDEEPSDEDLRLLTGATVTRG